MRANQTLRHFASFISILPHLTSKEREVLLNRLNTITLNKIGENYGVTAERIRQIEKDALTKVKSTSYQQSLFK